MVIPTKTNRGTNLDKQGHTCIHVQDVKNSSLNALPCELYMCLVDMEFILLLMRAN